MSKINRLTKKYKNGIITLDADKFPNVGQETLDREIGAFAPFRRAVEALCEYEDAEENGTLVRLPCKVGDTVYEIFNGKIRKRNVERFTVSDNGYCNIWFGTTISAEACQIGKTVFLTREAAEAALKARAEDGTT